jgi:hypothetical protein
MLENFGIEPILKRELHGQTRVSWEEFVNLLKKYSEETDDDLLNELKYFIGQEPCVFT